MVNNSAGDQTDTGTFLKTALYTNFCTGSQIFQHPKPSNLGADAAQQLTGGSQIAMVPTYSLMGPFRGHMSLKSSPFSPGPSCKLSNQYIIQDHMAAHFKKLMSAKAAVDSSAPKSLHTSVKYKDQQKRDRVIQTLEKYKKDLVHGLPATPFNSRSVSPRQQKMRWSLLENGHPSLMSGQNNFSGTKREQPPSVSFQKFPSKTLMPAPAARKSIPNSGPRALSQTPVHSSGTDRSSASLLPRSCEHLGSRNTKKAFQSSVHKTYSEDLLEKHAVYFTEKKQCFSPRILKTSHQSFLVKYRYYNPPSRRRSSSPSRPSFKSSDINNKRKSELHRFTEVSHIRPHSVQLSQQPVENHELWIQNSETPLFPGLQREEKEEEYLRFLQDLTNDILIRSCYHREALEDVFQMHIKSKRHNLDEVSKKRLVLNLLSPSVEMLYISAEQQFMADQLVHKLIKGKKKLPLHKSISKSVFHGALVKMRRIVQSLKKELNITNQPDLSISCEGTWQKDASIPAPCF